jgi:NADP-dependent 3-hydroxy acid dehydrogenase YdfG
MVAIVTGAASGIGAEVGRRLARAGAAVVLADIDEEGLAGVASELAAVGSRVLVVPTDVRVEEDTTRFADIAVREYGRIDLLVSAAGIAERGPIASGDVSRWQEVLATNVLGAALSVRAVAAQMIDQGAGDVVLLASVSGRESYVGQPLYVASKWAVVGLGHAIRQELASAGIRVLLLEPGIVDTPMNRNDPTARALLSGCDPLTPGDVAEAVLHAVSLPRRVAVTEIVVRPLAEPDLSMLGQTVPVDSRATGA